METQEFEKNSKKFEINQIEFSPYPKFPYLYVDIGDASSSLWGSTSSFIIFLDILKIFDH